MDDEWTMVTLMRGLTDTEAFIKVFSCRSLTRDRLLAEGNSLGSSRMLVETSVRPWRVVEDAKQKMEATLELSVSKVINSVPGIPKSELALLLTGI